MMSKQRQNTVKSKMLVKAQDQLADREEVRHIVRQQLYDHLNGGSFWNDFKDGFMSVIKPVASAAKAVLPIVAGPEGAAAASVIHAMGGKKGRKKGGEFLLHPSQTQQAPYEYFNGNNANAIGAGYGSGEPKPKRAVSAKVKARNAKVKAIMKKYKCSLPEASKALAEEERANK